MPMLKISELGKPSIQWADNEVDVPVGQSQALLFRLGAQREPIPYEHLGFLIWPGQPEVIKKRNISRLCNRLQRLLPTGNALIIGDRDVGLNTALIWSDAILFQQLAEDYNRSPRIFLLRSLIDLYRGPFLHGFMLSGCFEYNSWINVARRLWTRDYLAALQTLVEQSMGIGDFQLAITMARRYIDLCQADEVMHRHLIELYGLCGDRAAVQEQYDVCIEVLRRERGRDPGEATTMAYRSAMVEGLDYREIALPFTPHLEFADHQEGRRQLQYEPKLRRHKILSF